MKARYITRKLNTINVRHVGAREKKREKFKWCSLADSNTYKNIYRILYRGAAPLNAAKQTRAFCFKTKLLGRVNDDDDDVT